ncbi:hypothetical protein GGE56_004534 [Rhizobium leguminosarum]|uniref:Uncharacterized protein n=1 Tax=Rhizobium fabae TaxID=573179 RepID=A0A7W6B931_9HYPH|nr:hypothetical protein [Rhizobium fabae]MBB4343145.1 hypothetical protein [Rhizobium leguminosarum]MBB5261005.1 hypothetical protein [Rhizobium leguminosarum]MBB6296223.1 hypothetical protein [Rhizobium leguminosarum]
MFTFSVVEVSAVIVHGRTDAEANGGFRNPHYGLLPGKDERPGLWIVGDEGVYLLSNGKPAEGQRALSAIRRPIRTAGITSVGISRETTGSSSSPARALKPCFPQPRNPRICGRSLRRKPCSSP